jgi:hypothetical protein
LNGEEATSVIDKLATSLNRRDEIPNQELAQRIVDRGDKKAVKELVDNLTNRDKSIQGDCIKVLYEIGERKPTLIADYVKEFVSLLGSKNNRLVWGAMTALDTITLQNPEAIYSALSQIIETADKGSVITKDHGVSILVKLAPIRKYADEAFILLIQQLKSCPTNQLPMYAEKAMPIINDKNKAVFIKTLTSRLDSVKKETKRKRVEKVIEKLS